MLSLPLFDDLAFSMQALNLGMVHEFLLDLENDLLRELTELERTPPNTMFVSAISQLWVYGLYELLRTWRQRAEEVLAFAAKMSRASGTDGVRLLALKRRELLSSFTEPLSVQFRWNQFRKAAGSTSYVRKLRGAIDRYEVIFRRLEALRVRGAAAPRVRASWTARSALPSTPLFGNQPSPLFPSASASFPLRHRATLLSRAIFRKMRFT